MKRFEGKTALVTGAASGIGEAIARRLGQEGASLALLDINASELERVRQSLLGSGIEAIAEVGNVAVGEDAEHTIVRCAQRLGRLDVLVNCAGVIARGNLAETTHDEWHRVINTNLSSMFFSARAAAPHLRRTSGTIVNVASLSGSRAGVNVAYEASKGGVVSITRQLANELAADGVRVNSLSPGLTATALNADLRAAGAERKWAKRIPLGRYGTAEEVAAACAFLASEDASYISGVDLIVDGGLSSVLRPDPTVATAESELE